MNILLAVHHFPPRFTGGAELRAYRTARWLCDHGHRVHVLCVEAIDLPLTSEKRFVETQDVASLRAGVEGSFLTFRDDTYDGLPVRRLSFNLAASPDPFRFAYDNPWIGTHLSAYLSELKPDLLHLISGYLISGSALHAAVEYNLPTIVTLTDFWFLCPRITLLRSNGQICAPPFDPRTCAQCLGEQKRRYRIPGRFAPRVMHAFWARHSRAIAQVEDRMRFLRHTLNHVDAMISPSQFLRHLFVQAGVAPERIHFSRQGRDFDLAPDEWRKSPSDRLRIGYMGQIAPHKGVHVLFEAVRRLPQADLEVKVYGDTTHFPRYARSLRHMADRDPRLTLAGVYEREEITDVLRHLDVVIVPSIWYENSPNTILEAFAHHTPAIVSNLGGMAELVTHDQDGLHFPAGDAAALATQLGRLLEDGSLLARLQTGIAPVKSVAQEMSELLDIYRAARRAHA